MEAGLALSALGTFSSIQQANSQADFQSAQYERQAQEEEAASKLREEDRRDRLNRTISAQRVLFGAQGTTIDTNVLESTAGEFGKEQFNDDYNVTRRVNNLLASSESAQLTAKAKTTDALFDFGGTVAGAYAEG